MIPVCFRNTKALALLDTGADLSAVGQSFFDKLGISTKCLQPPSISFIKDAGGALHKISAEAVLDLKIADLEIKHKFFIIPNLNHSVILGYDFLTEYKVQISYENNTVIINDDQKQTEINMITNCSKA